MKGSFKLLDPELYRRGQLLTALARWASLLLGLAALGLLWHDPRVRAAARTHSRPRLWGLQCRPLPGLPAPSAEPGAQDRPRRGGRPRARPRGLVHGRHAESRLAAVLPAHRGRLGPRRLALRARHGLPRCRHRRPAGRVQGGRLAGRLPGLVDLRHRLRRRHHEFLPASGPGPPGWRLRGAVAEEPAARGGTFRPRAEPARDGARDQGPRRAPDGRQRDRQRRQPEPDDRGHLRRRGRRGAAPGRLRPPDDRSSRSRGPRRRGGGGRARGEAPDRAVHERRGRRGRSAGRWRGARAARRPRPTWSRG